MQSGDSQYRLEHLEYEWLLPLYEDARQSNPDDLSALIWLGHAYTALGRIEDGLDVDLRLTETMPGDPTVRYNLACSYSLLDRIEDAVGALNIAVDLGYRDLEHLLGDPDLAALHAEPGFQGILERLRAED